MTAKPETTKEAKKEGIAKVRRARTRTNYSIMYNDIWDDARLTAAAKGIFGYLWSKPSEGWTFRRSHCRAMNKNLTEYSLKQTLKELQLAGYLLIQPRRAERGQWRGWDWVIDDRPNKIWAKSAQEKFKVKVKTLKEDE